MLKRDYDASQPGRRAADQGNQREAARSERADFLAVQNVFTDRRAYVNASTYDIETETSPSSKQSKQRTSAGYKQEVPPSNIRTASKKDLYFDQLEEAYNELRNERTQAERRTRRTASSRSTNGRRSCDAYLTEHMVSLTPSQITDLLKTRRLDSEDPAD